MAKYDRLKEFLINSDEDTIDISFDEIENILLFPYSSIVFVDGVQ